MNTFLKTRINIHSKQPGALFTCHSDIAEWKTFIYNLSLKIIAVDIFSDVTKGVFIRYLALKQDTKIKKWSSAEKNYQGKWGITELPKTKKLSFFCQF